MFYKGEYHPESAFYRGIGIYPSDTMKSTYRLIELEAGCFKLNPGTIKEGLKGKEVINGAYFCDAELFRYFYKFERLRDEPYKDYALRSLYWH